MTKVRRTNISKKMEIEEIIESEEQTAKRMASFFEGEKNQPLIRSYNHLTKAINNAKIYLKNLK